MVSISLKIPKDMNARLGKFAQKRGITKSDAVRLGVERMLSDRPGDLKGSVLDLVADLAGCVEGPGDLSYNKKHLEGFGQ